MKVYPFKIPKPDRSALVYQEDHEAAFYDKYHQHEEIQLSYILKGEGTLVVGDSVHHYSTDDVLILGGNVPHVFKSEIKEHQKSSMLSLFFNKEALGDQFFELGEFEILQRIIAESALGLKITTNTAAIKKVFTLLKGKDQLNRFIAFLEIVSLLNKAQTEKLSSFVYPKNYTDSEGERMRKVFEYTMDHFYENISLNDIANSASLTRNAFCKYFKQRTQKNYMQFLSEIRIAHACKLLRNKGDHSIADIAVASGFRNISNFNRQFKRIKNTNPLKYRINSN